jgi:hypothetical protein
LDVKTTICLKKTNTVYLTKNTVTTKYPRITRTDENEEINVKKVKTSTISEVKNKKNEIKKIKNESFRK